MVSLGAIERSMCLTMASFLRKDALVYGKEELEAETPRSARAAMERPTSRVSERRPDDNPAPAVLFRSIVATATVFLLSGLACVFLLYSAMSYRWLVLDGLSDSVPPLVTRGLRFSCLGANCVEIAFANASSCGRSESAVAMRYRSSLGLLSLSFAFFVIAGLIGSILTKRFSFLRSVFKVLRHNPEYFLRPGFRIHTEHPQFYRKIMLEQECADREAAQAESKSNFFLNRWKRNESERGAADVEMRSVTTSLRGAIEDTKDLADLWESDTDDDAERPGRAAPNHRPPQVQYRRSLKRKQDRLVRASQKIHEIRRKSQTAIHLVLLQTFFTWFGWAAVVCGTAIFHNTEGDWLHCGKSACDVMTDYSCAYGPGFATAITATLVSSFCIVASVLVAAFGLADLYACLSAAYELSRYHDAQINLVTVELARGGQNRSQLTEQPTADEGNIRVLTSEDFTPRARRS